MLFCVKIVKHQILCGIVVLFQPFCITGFKRSAVKMNIIHHTTYIWTYKLSSSLHNKALEWMHLVIIFLNSTYSSVHFQFKLNSLLVCWLVCLFFAFGVNFSVQVFFLKSPSLKNIRCSFYSNNTYFVMYDQAQKILSCFTSWLWSAF